MTRRCPGLPNYPAPCGQPIKQHEPLCARCLAQIRKQPKARAA